MLSIDIFMTYTLACLFMIIVPGPDNLLAIGRGISQGKLAAGMSGLSSGAGILFHVIIATLGLSLLIQMSVIAFTIVKLIGAAYLIWLGIKILRSRDLIDIKPAQIKSLPNIFSIGFLSAALNPKPGMFVLAFIPQFIDPTLGSVTSQMIFFGAWFALLTTLGFALMGIVAANFGNFLDNRPKIVSGLNFVGAATFILSGMAVALLKHKG